MPEPAHPMRAYALTLAAGALGGAVFSLCGVPLPWILGSIFGVIVAARLPLPRAMSLARPPRGLLTPARIVLGLAIGAAFDQSVVDNATLYAASLLFLLPYIAIIAGLGSWYFRRFGGMDGPTAFLCAVPGGLAELLLLSDDLKADARKVALAQGIRILALVYSLPFVAGALSGDAMLAAAPPTVPGLLDTAALDAVMLCALGLAGWRGLAALRISGAAIVGPMVAAAIATLGGWLGQGPPDEVFKAAQWVLGTSVGAVFIGHRDKGLLPSVLRSSIGFLLILAAITAATAATVHVLLDVPAVPAVLAFAPGGQAEMSLIAVILDENPAYVALHHLARLMLIVSLLPSLARRGPSLASARGRRR